MNQAKNITDERTAIHNKCLKDCEEGVASGARYTVDIREGASFNWSAGKRLTERGSKK